MLLDLREIIDVPGASLPFAFDIDLSGLESGSVVKIGVPARVEGKIDNEAGMILLTGVLTADTTCVCARCLKEFGRHVELPLRASLAEEIQDETECDAYLIVGGSADVDEIARTAFVLNTEQRLLCREDCRGLCPTCGKDLNEGPCSCREAQDPRLAVLGQLLEK